MKKSSKTDWKALESMTDEEIDHSDIPKLPSIFFKHAKKWHPQSKVKITVELDEDLLQWFKEENDDWESRMQTALRLYVETHKESRRIQDLTH
ncbi:BrnA antitoxin family protein [Desulfonema limicola]|nr:BrnA antitoxin family protein [Desulfonema limicola]